MQIEVLADPDAVAGRAAALIAEEARTAVAERRRFVMAVSGGHTPWIMLRMLAGQEQSPGAIFMCSRSMNGSRHKETPTAI